LKQHIRLIKLPIVSREQFNQAFIRVTFHGICRSIGRMSGFLKHYHSSPELERRLFGDLASSLIASRSLRLVAVTSGTFYTSLSHSLPDRIQRQAMTNPLCDPWASIHAKQARSFGARLGTNPHFASKFLPKERTNCCSRTMIVSRKLGYLSAWCSTSVPNTYYRDRSILMCISCIFLI